MERKKFKPIHGRYWDWCDVVMQTFASFITSDKKCQMEKSGVECLAINVRESGPRVFYPK